MRTTGVNWAAVIQSQQESGLSQREYCERHKLALSTFTNRKTKLNKSNTAITLFKPHFIELDVPTPVRSLPAPEEVVIELPYGVVMRFRGMAR